MISADFVTIVIALVIIIPIILYIKDVLNAKITAITMSFGIILGILLVVYTRYIDNMRTVTEDFPYRTDYISEVNGESLISTEITSDGRLYLSYVTSSGKERLTITEKPLIIISDEAKVMYYKRIQKGNLFYYGKSDSITIYLPEEDLQKVLVFDVIDYD